MMKWIGPLVAIAIAVFGLQPSWPVAGTPSLIPEELLTVDINTLLAWEAVQPYSFALSQAVDAHLETFDIESLPLEEAVSLRTRQWQDSVYEGVAINLSLHRYPIHNWRQTQIEWIEFAITYWNPLRSEEDIANYLDSLSGVAQQYDGLMDSVLKSEAIGAVPPRHILEDAAQNLYDRAALIPTQDSYYTNLSTRLAANEDIAEERRIEVLAEAETIITSSIQPATLALADFVMDLASRATEAIGVWRHENGDIYYSVMLKQYTTTDLTADEIHDQGLAQVGCLRQEFSQAANALDLDGSQPLPELCAQVAEQTGTLSGEETVGYCRGLIEKVSQAVRPAFLEIPEAELDIVMGNQLEASYGGAYLDGSRPATFFTPASGKAKYQIPTLTFHETIPGHHLDSMLKRQYDIPEHRKWSMLTASTEGWAFYAERLAWELGAYDDDPYGNLGRLQYELMRAVRMVVDTGIHARQWTYDQAVSYMIDNTGLSEDYVREQVDRYAVSPGASTSYMVGMMKILELRERAQEALGSQFDLAEFHDAILRHGDVPLSVLDWIIDKHIESVLNRT